MLYVCVICVILLLYCIEQLKGSAAEKLKESEEEMQRKMERKQRRKKAKEREGCLHRLADSWCSRRGGALCGF
jgi:hypothetical protein